MMTHFNLLSFVRSSVAVIGIVLLAGVIESVAGARNFKAKEAQPRTETSMRFSGTRVNGHSVTPFGASLVGEQDKEVFSLLELRRDFADREAQERGRFEVAR